MSELSPDGQYPTAAPSRTPYSRSDPSYNFYIAPNVLDGNGTVIFIGGAATIVEFNYSSDYNVQIVIRDSAGSNLFGPMFLPATLPTPGCQTGTFYYQSPAQNIASLNIKSLNNRLVIDNFCANGQLFGVTATPTPSRRPTITPTPTVTLTPTCNPTYPVISDLPCGLKLLPDACFPLR